MGRIAAIFVAICMVLIAVALGAVLYLLFGLSGVEATLVGLACLTALGLYNAVCTRLRDRTDVGDQIADLSRGTADLARQVAEIGRRLASVEGRLDGVSDRARAEADPLAAEIGELGTLIKQLAETVAAHEAALASRAAPLSVQPSPAAPATPPADAAATGTTDVGAPDVTRTAASAAATATSAASAKDLVPIIRSAVAANRIDLYLQPIVTLPQRKVRYYEAMSRLRSESGDLLTAADFLAQAESAGLMPGIDNLILFRCVQVVRRLLLKNRDIGLFCNISPLTLADATTFPQFLEFVEANRALATSLVFEFSQAALRSMGPIEQESLAALADRGFRFSMDNVGDLRMEPRELAERGIRFVKVPARLLLNRASSGAADIHPEDLSDLLGRHGVDLVAERIESEAMVVDLLDYDVRYGQGFLFSPPRPVRAEALQGVAERSDLAVREVAPAARGGELRGSLQLVRGVAKRV